MEGVLIAALTLGGVIIAKTVTQDTVGTDVRVSFKIFIYFNLISLIN